MYLAAIVAVIALAAFGVWNPRDHVAVTLVLDHALIAYVLVVALAIGGVMPRRDASFEPARRAVGPLLVVVLVGGLLYVGDRVGEVKVEAVAAVPGTDLEVSVRNVPRPFDEKRKSYLFIDQGKGVWRRRVRVNAEAHWAYPPYELRASSLSRGVLRVEWLRPGDVDPLLAWWDVTFDQDTLEATRVEMTDCSIERAEAIGRNRPTVPPPPEPASGDLAC
ncbi:MAG TPA: hypothetical protein VF228_00295 [Iamia sp.]